MSIQAYQRAAAQADSPRDLEYRAFGQATAALLRAIELPRTEIGAIAEALELNRRLWTLLSADCAQEGNQLGPVLRAQIISMALWVTRHSSAVLRENAEIQPLIDINKTMMDGLQSK